MGVDLSRFAILVQNSEDFRGELQKKFPEQVDLFNKLAEYTETIMSENQLFNDVKLVGNGDKLNVFGIMFKKISEIELEEQSNKYKTYFFDPKDYSRTFHKYGQEEFCYFSNNFFKKIPEEAGVYCWVFNSKPVYIGECVNLKKRMRAYGKLTISACHYQSTDCKMNSEILKTLNKNQTVELFFYKTESHDAVEQYILRCKNFPLNKKDN
jgi:hypothetical protein